MITKIESTYIEFFTKFKFNFERSEKKCIPYNFNGLQPFQTFLKYVNNMSFKRSITLFIRANYYRLYFCKL